MSAAVDHAALAPDVDAFARQLHHLFGELAASADGLVEVAWTPPSEGGPKFARQFGLDELEMAAEHMAARSAEGRNVYVAAGLRAPHTPRGMRATANFVTGVAALWSDFDAEGAAAAALETARAMGIPPTLVVQTASVPHQRVQLWWRLDEPCTDLNAASEALAALAATLGGDGSVRNVDRIMRAAGSIAQPVKPGRIAEVTRILDDWSDRRPPYAFEEIAKALEGRAALPRHGNLAEIFDINAVRPRTSPAQRFASSYEPGAWYDNTRDLIARMVHEGSSDATIAALAPAFTRDGFTVEHTARELLEFARGARAKGWGLAQADGEVEPGELEPTGFTGELPPPRPWAYGDFLMERAVTGVAAPPGVGKTTFSFQIGLAFALDLDLGPWTPRPGGGGKAWLFNGEEPKEELDRRFIAACAEMGAREADAAERFAYNSGLPRPLRLGAQDDRGRFVRSADVDKIKDIIQRSGFKLFILDPLIEFHTVKENDLEAFGRVGAVCREIAVDCDCSVLVFHHTPKTANADTAAGDMNALRGGGPLIGVARFVHTMFAMTAKDAERLNVSARERPSFVRWDNAKANMGPVDGHTQWWRKLGVTIGNAAGVRPADNIGVLRAAHLDPVETDEEGIAGARAVSAGEELDALAGEVVRVCLANGHTTPESGVALTALCEAIDFDVTRMRATKARGLIAGKMAGGFDRKRHRIFLTHAYRGERHHQRVHVEAVGDAA